MSSTIPLPPRQQLYNRYCSNKHTPGGVLLVTPRARAVGETQPPRHSRPKPPALPPRPPSFAVDCRPYRHHREMAAAQAIAMACAAATATIFKSRSRATATIFKRRWTILAARKNGVPFFLRHFFRTNEVCCWFLRIQGGAAPRGCKHQSCALFLKIRSRPALKGVALKHAQRPLRSRGPLGCILVVAAQVPHHVAGVDRPLGPGTWR